MHLLRCLEVNIAVSTNDGMQNFMMAARSRLVAGWLDTSFGQNISTTKKADRVSRDVMIVLLDPRAGLESSEGVSKP